MLLDSYCVSIVLPTFNERDNIKIIIPLIASIMRRNGINYEVIVVDDNSPDKTWEVAKSFEDIYNVEVYVRRGERGLSSAVIYGAKQSSCNYIVVMDADLQHPPEKIVDIVKKLHSGCDIVVASRYIDGGGVEGWSKLRLLESIIATQIARLVLSPARRVRDPLSGFFGVRKDLLLNPEIKPLGYKILLEVLVKNAGARVCEIPYVFRSRKIGKSKLGVRTILEYIAQIIWNIIYLSRKE